MGAMPKSPGHRKNASSMLPSLNTDSSTAADYESFREPSKLDKLTELSQKFKNV